jgi:hypothetical protein
MALTVPLVSAEPVELLWLIPEAVAAVAVLALPGA